MPDMPAGEDLRALLRFCKCAPINPTPFVTLPIVRSCPMAPVNIPRRSLLAGGLGLVAVPAIARKAPAAPGEIEFLNHLRRRRLEGQAIHHTDEWCDSAEGDPIHVAFEAYDDEFSALARRYLNRAPRSWADVAIRAEIARHWSTELNNGRLSYSDGVPEMAAASLIAAVRAMTGEAYERPIEMPYPYTSAAELEP